MVPRLVVTGQTNEYYRQIKCIQLLNVCSGYIPFDYRKTLHVEVGYTRSYSIPVRSVIAIKKYLFQIPVIKYQYIFFIFIREVTRISGLQMHVASFITAN